MSEPGSIAPPSDRYLPAVLYGCIPIFEANAQLQYLDLSDTGITGTIPR